MVNCYKALKFHFIWKICDNWNENEKHKGLYECPGLQINSINNRLQENKALNKDAIEINTKFWKQQRK